MKCKSCDLNEAIKFDICNSCYVDPKDNKCKRCNIKRSDYICYEYICGQCILSGK